MRGFQFCTGGEDPKCSNSLQDFQFYNHRTYYGFRVGRLHKDDIINSSNDDDEINESLINSILKTPYSPFIKDEE